MTFDLVGSGARRAPAFVLALITATALGCGSDSTEPQAPDVASIDISVTSELEIGDADRATAVARDESGTPIPGVAVTWSSTFPEVATINSDGDISTKAIGMTEIIATAGGKASRQRLVVSPPPLLINEVAPDGDSNGGWIELFNSTSHPIDLANWFFVTVLGPTHVELYVFPAGSVIGPGEFVVVDEGMIPGSLKASGTVALFSRFAVESDAFSWTGNASGTAYARCADGDRFGSLVPTTVPTRKAPNVCRT